MAQSIGNMKNKIPGIQHRVYHLHALFPLTVESNAAPLAPGLHLEACLTWNG